MVATKTTPTVMKIHNKMQDPPATASTYAESRKVKR